MITEVILLNSIISTAILILIYVLDREEKKPPLFVDELYLVAILATFLYGELTLPFLSDGSLRRQP